MSEEVERVARAMAVADGFDPDGHAGGGPNDFALRAVEFNGFAVGVYRKVWEKYRRQANLQIAAFRALSEGS